MPPLRIELFGALRITSGDAPVASVNTSRLQSLLAYLVLHGDGAVSRERLAFLLWPDSGEAQARTNLRQLLHHLRRALPQESNLLVSDHHTVQWRRNPSCTADVWEFQAAVDRGAGDEAVRLYRDDLLSGLYDDWIVPLRARYHEQLAGVLRQLALACEQRGDLNAAICHAERLAAHDPLCEPHHQMLIRLHAAARDRAGALRAYHQCMRLLRRELGVEPCAATRELFERILKSEGPSGAPAEAPPTSAAAPLPIVGRLRERERLREAWNAAASGALRMAVILGEPGIGKSRLAEEVCGWAGRERRAVARTRCYPGQAQVAFAPIADWLRSEPLRAVRSHLSAPQLRELARVLPEILEERPDTPAPAPLTDGRDRLFFHETLNAAFGRAAKPLLLAIDDLQWCDADSLDWLRSLARSPAASQVLVLGTARAEELGRDHPLTRLLGEWRQSADLVEIPLAPLDAGETGALAAQVAGRPLTEADLARIYRGTGGNPLFVVESMRAGLQGDTPPRIHAVISSRLAQLSREAYELAGFAAAVGCAFSFDLLARATDWDEASLNQALDELWQRRIVVGHGAADYDFSHDRLREVAYQELTLVRRRFLHRRLARVTGKATPQSAAHYEAAGMAEEAIEAWSAASEVARGRYADQEAAALLGRALALCRDMPETARREAQELELLLALGPVLVTTRGYASPSVGENYARALTLARRSAESRHLFASLSGFWVFQIVRGRIVQSYEVAEEFLRVAGQRREQALTLAAHFVAGSSLFHLNRMQESREHMESALAAYGGPAQSALGLFAGPDVGVSCPSYLAHIYWHLGDIGEAERRSREALAAAEELARPFSLAIALDYQAMLHAFERNSGAALQRSRQAIALCRTHQFAYYLAVAEILCGWAMALEGEGETGVAQLRRGLDALKDTDAELRLPFYYALLAEACAAAGRRGDALANVASGLAFQSKNEETWAAPVLARIQKHLQR